jgi:PAS domain S-box-containing protein
MGTWRWDLPTGAITWDVRLERIYGLAPGAFDGTFERYVSMLHPDDRDRVLDLVESAVAAKAPYRFEHRIVRADGVVRWVVCAGAVTTDDTGAAVGTVGVVGDVTERVEQQLERDRLAAVAVAAEARERQQRERLEFLATINDSLNGSRTIHDIMSRVTAAAVPRLGDLCAIHVFTDAAAVVPEVRVAYADADLAGAAADVLSHFPFDPEAEQGVPAVIRTGRTEFHRRVDDVVRAAPDLPDGLRDAVARLGLRSSITVPLSKRGRTLGAIQFATVGEREYGEDDVALAIALGNRIAVSVENRRLGDEQRRIAQTLQRSLLPSTLPEIPGVDIAVRYWAAGESTEVGGDFYDVFAIEDGRWAVVVGDVCGTGPEAAALTGLARHTLRDATWHGDGPSGALLALNRAILHGDVRSFCTAVFAEVRPAGDEIAMSVASGGHPLPIRLRDRTGSTLGESGTLLGMLGDARSTTVEVSLRPGDAIVFYTDGATDASPPFGLTADEFLELVEASRDASAEAIADNIHHRLEAIRPFDERNDDLALLVMEVRDVSGDPHGPGSPGSA